MGITIDELLLYHSGYRAELYHARGIRAHHQRPEGKKMARSSSTQQQKQHAKRRHTGMLDPVDFALRITTGDSSK